MQVSDEASITLLLPTGQDLTEAPTPRITFTGEEDVEEGNDIGTFNTTRSIPGKRIDLPFCDSSWYEVITDIK